MRRQEVYQRGHAHLGVDQRIVVDDRADEPLDLVAEGVMIRENEQTLLPHPRDVFGQQRERRRFPAAGPAGEANLAASNGLAYRIELAVRNRRVRQAIDCGAIPRHEALPAREDVSDRREGGSIAGRRLGEQHRGTSSGGLQQRRPRGFAPGDVIRHRFEVCFGDVREPGQSVDEDALVAVPAREVIDGDHGVADLFGNGAPRCRSPVDWEDLGTRDLEAIAALLLDFDREQAAEDRSWRRRSRVAHPLREYGTRPR